MSPSDGALTHSGHPQDAALAISLDTRCGLKEDAVQASQSQQRRAKKRKGNASRCLFFKPGLRQRVSGFGSER